MVTACVPVVGTSPEGTPTSLRFGFVDGSLFTYLQAPPVSAEAEVVVSSLVKTPVISRAAPTTTTTAAMVRPTARLRRRFLASSARRSSWRWRCRCAAWRRCLFVGTGELLGRTGVSVGTRSGGGPVDTGCPLPAVEEGV